MFKLRILQAYKRTKYSIEYPSKDLLVFYLSIFTRRQKERRLFVLCNSEILIKYFS